MKARKLPLVFCFITTCFIVATALAYLIKPSIVDTTNRHFHSTTGDTSFIVDNHKASTKQTPALNVDNKDEEIGTKTSYKSEWTRFHTKCVSRMRYKELQNLLKEGKHSFPYELESVIKVCWYAGRQHEKDAEDIFIMLMSEALENPYGTADFLFPPNKEKAKLISRELEHAYGPDNKQSRLYMSYSDCFFRFKHMLPVGDK